jgi:hypothetical protein
MKFICSAVAGGLWTQNWQEQLLLLEQELAAANSSADWKVGWLGSRLSTPKWHGEADGSCQSAAGSSFVVPKGLSTTAACQLICGCIRLCN